MTIWRWLTVWMVLAIVWSTPIYALGTPDVSSHGQRLWHLAELEQQTLEQSGVMLHDTAMERRLRAVALRLWDKVTTDLKSPVVKVIIETRADAVTYPNGVVLLTTGMLEQIENEDQLAIILAHELVHYARQHTIQLYDHLWLSGQENNARSADRPSSVVEADVEQMVNAAEYQADSEGLIIFKAAGYCETEIPTLLSTMIDHMQAQGPSRDLNEMTARKARIQAMINPSPAKGPRPSTTVNGQGFFMDCIAPALMANAQIAIQRGNWDVAEQSLTTYIAGKPDDARAYYLQGEMMRRRGDNDDEKQSMAYYQAALKIDPKFPPVHRALGELHFKAGQFQQAKPYFETFLSLSPEDESRAFIEGYLHQCQK